MSTARPNLRSVAPCIVVTGGCGFVGCNLVDALAARGEQVLVLDNLCRSGTEENAEWLRSRHRDRVVIEQADVRDLAVVRSAVRDAKAVLHLAAQVAVTTSLESPLDDFCINAMGTLNVLESVRLINPSAPILFASTNKVYGKLLTAEDVVQQEDRYVPRGAEMAHGVSEGTPLDLYSPYGCSKGAADQYVRDYSRIFGLRTVVLRMSCIYGPRQFGNEDQGWIAHFLLQAIRGKPITVYGDGYQVRDALFVDDAVRAWLRALERIDAVGGKIFNLGGGPEHTVSLRELMRLIGDVRGTPPEFDLAPWRPGDQPWYVSDIRAISAALDWQPRMSVGRGLRALAAWLDERWPDSGSSRREARA